MIRVTNVNHFAPYADVVTERQVSVGRAFQLLAQAELAYGGNILSISLERVVVHTEFFMVDDTVTFEGTHDEMNLLVMIAIHFKDNRVSVGGFHAKNFGPVREQILQIFSIQEKTNITDEELLDRVEAFIDAGDTAASLVLV